MQRTESLKVSKPLKEEIVKLCEKEKMKINDFVETAIKNELKRRKGD